MKRLSLQWRITLMTVLLIGITCVAMNLLLCSSGVYYMDTIADSLQGGGTVILNDGGAASFDPQLIAPNEELTIVVDGVQGSFRTTNWYITAAVTLLSGILAYFVSGRALKPLRSFASQVEQVQLNNLADMRIDEDAISEFRQLSRSFNQMLERLNNAFAAQRQFTGNAAHELRTPLALMQAQLELFSAEHPDVRPETAEFLTLLREQTERLTQMTKTLLEMSNLQQVARNEQLQLAPMVEEIFTDLAPLAEKRSITLEAEGDAALTGSDALIYRMLFNLTENAVKYNRPGGTVRVELCTRSRKSCMHSRFRHRLRHSGGISAQYLPALLPGRQVPQPRIRRRGTGTLSGVGDRQSPRRLRLGREKFGEGHYHCGGVANATINEALKPFYSFFAASLAALRRSSLYGAVSRKEKRPFSISNSLQPVSGSTSVSLQTAGCLRLYAVSLFLRSVLWVRIWISGVFLVKPNIGGLFLLRKPCSHKLSFLRLCRTGVAFFGCFLRLLTWEKRRFSNRSAPDDVCPVRRAPIR